MAIGVLFVGKCTTCNHIELLKRRGMKAVKFATNDWKGSSQWVGGIRSSRYPWLSILIML